VDSEGLFHALAFAPAHMPLHVPRLLINGKFSAQPTTGVQRYATELLCALDGRIAKGGWAGPPPLLLQPPGARPLSLTAIETRTLPGPRGLRHARGTLHAWEQIALPRALRAEPPGDAVLLSLAGSAPGLLARQIVTFHDAAVFDHPKAYGFAFQRWYRALFRHLGPRVLKVLTNSDFSRGRLVEALGLSTDRIAIVPGGGDHLSRVVADEGALQRHGLRPQRYLLVVASLSPTKNFAALQRAFSGLARREGITLVRVGGADPYVFAGESGEPDWARSGPETESDPTGVRCLGKIDDAALKSLLANALALVQPSVYEGFGLPPLEAMALGCPVAVARAGSLPSVCSDAALYFDPHDDDSIARSLQQLIDDEALRRKLRAAGQARASSFRWGAAAERLQGVLATVPGLEGLAKPREPKVLHSHDSDPSAVSAGDVGHGAGRRATSR
jgi:glycosyltransferase involved in cell wall biosynthesis